MKYYSEESIRIRFSSLGYNETVSNAIISGMNAVELPTLESNSSDRERIRMELWKEVYLQASKDDNYTADIYSIDAKDALEEFDKQFPKL